MSFFSEDQIEHFIKSVSLLVIGFIFYVVGITVSTFPEGTKYNIAYGVAWVGIGLIFAAIGYAAWHFRSGLFPFNEPKQDDGVN